MRKTRFLLMAVVVMMGVVSVSCEKDNNDTKNDNNVVDNGDDGNENNNTGSTVEWVDLGLPSGLLWADRNVGANSPEDYGNYFAWGETRTKLVYSWETYTYCNSNYDQLTKYCDSASYGYNGFTDDLTTLQSGDDAATANWGSDWRTPTYDDWQELWNNCDSAWVMQNGVKGCLFTGRNGNVLFLPAAGGRWNVELYYTGHCGYYWSSCLYTDSPRTAWYFSIPNTYKDIESLDRYVGLSVRPVRSARQN